MIKKLIKAAISLIIIAALAVGAINLIMINAAKENISSLEEINAKSEEYDCAIVLGAKVWESGNLSHMLSDRMDYGISLYKSGAAKKLLLSGDHGQQEYDEVNAMKEYALEKGVPEEDIFLDHAGFSTYESMYRARDVFKCKKVLVVTQGFHISRAVYIANELGLDATGVPSDPRRYANQWKNDLREALARTKDFLTVNVFKPLPKYLGEEINIAGDGRKTHDK